VLEKKIKQVAAAETLGLCDRQVRRIVARVKTSGDKGIIHKSRGQPSNRALPDELKDKVKELYEQKYNDFGPKFANEKLFEIHRIRLGNQTLRNWLIDWGLWQVSQKRRKHRHWRERKHRYGEMIQMDGSHHPWFEDRSPKCVLMGYIDDATSIQYARLYKYEGTIPAMDSFKRYIRKYGLPQSVYLDKHTTYKSPAKLTIEDELNDREALSQFGRALKELGVKVIHANSAAAKGRVERMFKTFQYRLIREFRLNGINTIEEGNKFLDSYLPKHNRQFGVQALESGDLHRPLPTGIDLDKILCIRTEKCLRNDFTIVHEKKLYQILSRVNAKKVMVEETTQGWMFITYNGRRLDYKRITKMPIKTDVIKNVVEMRLRKTAIPAMGHPWRRYAHINSYPQKEKSSKKEKGLLLVQT